MTRPYIDVLFEYPDASHELRFVEVESPSGISVDVGQWVTRPDGFRALRLRVKDFDDSTSAKPEK